MKFVAAFLSLSLFLPSLTRAEPARAFSRISEVVENWDGQQKLWVSGSLGVSGPQLTALESWLDVNGPNWTVVLMQNAGAQRYDGKSGMNAVEFALGEGLSNRTGFGKLVDKRTGETNGAVFVLFLDERKFSYFASDAFDNRSLGERYWVGRLDKPAVSAMRNGGRIVDAVKNTVSNIESSLTRKLEEEEQRKRLAEIEKQRAIEEAEKYPALLDKRIGEVVRKGNQLLQSASGAAEGPIFIPDLAKWEANKESIRKLVAVGSLQNAQVRFAETNLLIDAHEARLDLWARAPERFSRLEKQLATHPGDPEAPLLSGLLAKSKQALQSSKENHANGEPLYTEQLEEAERNYDRADAAYTEWIESQKRKRLFFQAVTLLSAFAFIVFLVVANRLRRPAKEEALALFDKWRKILDGKFDELFSLMDRTSLVVGSSADLDERGFTGTTEALARKTIRDVDELFIMSAATDRVMEKVEALVEPKSLAGKLSNRFSSRRYRKAVSLLTAEPIGFDRKDHLEAILNPKSPAREEGPTRTLLGEADDYQPFRISFEKLNEEYDLRQAAAREEIARLEAGIDGLPITQQDLLKTLSETSQLAGSLAALGVEDTLFPLVSLRQDWIPNAERHLMKAGKDGESDPVAAFETLLPEASRLVLEAQMVARTTEAFRSIDLPVMQRSVERLTAQERSTSWVDDALSGLVARSEQLMKRGSETSISEDWAEFDDDLTKLKGRILSCEGLSTRIIEEISQRISQVQTEVAQARQDLATRLSLPPEKVLSEAGLTPDAKVGVAARGIGSALAAIDNGQALTARKTLAEVEAALDDAGAMIQLSRECIEKHSTIHAELTGERNGLLKERTPVEALLKEMQSGYAPSVLTFSSRFGENLDGQLSVVNSIERANRRFEKSGRELEESSAAFRSGKLIQAYTLLETVADELGFARHQLALVKDQHEALRDAESTNRTRAENLQNHLEELLNLSEDRRTIQATIASLRKTGERVLSFVDSMEQLNRDPFVQFREGEDLERRLHSLQDGIDGDWKAHENAEAAETSARAALTFCHQYLKEARTDNIPDSRTLTRAIQRHGELTRDLEEIEKELQGAHADWNDLFARISEIDGETAMVKSTLQEQLAAAREASDKLNGAASEIRKLTKWRSSYSVRINRHAGKIGRAHV